MLISLLFSLMSFLHPFIASFLQSSSLFCTSTVKHGETNTANSQRTTHILHTFTPNLRALAATDKLLASAGIAGGVSGFVQAVLVPELALSLVSEDLETASSNDQKRKGGSSATIATMDLVQVLEESAELGELLNPEVSISEERSAGLRRRRGSEDQDEQEDAGGVG